MILKMCVGIFDKISNFQFLIFKQFLITKFFKHDDHNKHKARVKIKYNFMQYDLEDRTRKFSKDIIQTLSKIKENSINKSIINQLVRSSTSVGANYCEANAASSKRDFKNKIFICRKEIQETKYWIEMLAHINQEIKKELRILWKEAHELTLIFNKISSSLRN